MGTGKGTSQRYEGPITAGFVSCQSDESFPDISRFATASKKGEAEGSSTSASVPTSSFISQAGAFLAALASSGVGDRSSDDIEMEPPTGRRRRKSSLMNPVGQFVTPPAKSMALGGYWRHLSINLPGRPDFVEEDCGSSSPSVRSGKDEEPRDSSGNEDLHDDEETGLTKKERATRRRRRRRNTQIGQRFARGERKEADKDIVKTIFINGALILSWYLFSLSISLYNKWMFDRDRLNFAFPLFTTSLHMLVQFVLATLVLYFVPSLRPRQAHTSDRGSSRHETESNNPVMTKMFYLTRVGPCGAATGLDIGLGNASLKLISLTFYTMCKSSSLAFVLIFAFAFRLEKPTWRLVAIIATMTMGVILMVFGEVEFKLGGFALVISAAFFSGFRWGLTQILLLRNPATSNPFSSIFYLTPAMFLTLIFLAVPVEGFGPLWVGLRTLTNEWGVVMTPLFLLFPGCIAFLMTASEFALLKRTSVVTLSIAGIFKEVVTISAASLVFQEKLTPINLIGLITTMLAIVAYNYVKISNMREEAQAQLNVRATDVDGLSSMSSNTSDAENDDSPGETARFLQQNIQMAAAPVPTDGEIQWKSLRSPVGHITDKSGDQRPRSDF